MPAEYVATRRTFPARQATGSHVPQTTPKRNKSGNSLLCDATQLFCFNTKTTLENKGCSLRATSHLMTTWPGWPVWPTILRKISEWMRGNYLLDLLAPLPSFTQFGDLTLRAQVAKQPTSWKRPEIPLAVNGFVAAGRPPLCQR